MGKPIELTEEKKVTIQLFKDADKYADDVFVGINGRAYLLQRGVDIEVPESVAEVLKNSQKQDLKANVLMEKLAQEYKNRKEEME